MNLTCVYCKARMLTKVDKKIDPMKFVSEVDVDDPLPAAPDTGFASVL